MILVENYSGDILIFVFFIIYTGMNQFNHMALPNAQISQAPMGARAASPMNHPQQMNMTSVPPVKTLGGVCASS